MTIPATVVAVVVTHRRSELLRRSLAAIGTQTRPVDAVVVVDNASEQATEEVVRASGLPVTYLPSERNLGGAGGFALGMLHALALGADWVWCADDDGRPADDAVLATLLDAAERHGLAEVSPLVTDEADPERLAFPLRRGLRWRRRRSDFAGLDLLPGYASLFNGALFRADNETNGYLIALSDAGLAVRVQPNAANIIASEINKDAKPNWSVQLIELARITNYVPRDRMPLPDDAAKIVNEGHFASRVTTFGKSNIEINSDFLK